MYLPWKQQPMNILKEEILNIVVNKNDDKFNNSKMIERLQQYIVKIVVGPTWKY